jgi:hypothetical protein
VKIFNIARKLDLYESTIRSDEKVASMRVAAIGHILSVTNVNFRGKQAAKAKPA